MKAYLCGLWDNCNLWLQWDDAGSGVAYQMEIRFRKPGAEEWQSWKPIERGKLYTKNWMVVPTWMADMEAQARVAIIAEEPEWVLAEEVTFRRSRCRFLITSERRKVRYAKGAEFHSIVDGAACHYRLMEEIEIEKGGELEVEMEASLTTGYCQLDWPGHFATSPYLGLTIRNSAESVDDFDVTGRDYTKMAVLQRDEPIKIVFGPSSFQGAA